MTPKACHPEREATPAICHPERRPQAGVEGSPRPSIAPRAQRADTPALEARDVACGYNGRPVLEHVSFTVAPGSATVLLGPNGVGKTTLFKTMLGFLPRLAGQVFVDGEEVRGWTRKRFAQSVAYVPQTHDAAFGFTVREMVLMGRTPAAAAIAGPSREDERIACEAIDRLGLGPLADRDCTTLSGGERQMVLVARALAQQPRLLVMDEPCANLDLGNQVVVLRQVRALAESGLVVVVTSHDPNHAFMLDGDVVCVGRGGHVVSGRAAEVLTPAALGQLYGIDVGVGDVAGPHGARTRACVAFMDEGEGESE